MLTEWRRQYQALECTLGWTLEELARWTNELWDVQNLIPLSLIDGDAIKNNGSCLGGLPPIANALR